MKIKLTHKDISALQITLKKEYLLTNGRGGYCSSTILDCHMRKYHGLLVLPQKRWNQVYNFLSKLEATVIFDKKEFHLSTNKFPIVFEPTGHKYIDSFEMEYYPVTTYKIGDTVIRKTILMPFGEETILVKWEVVKSEIPLLLRVTPLFAYREIHSLTQHNMDLMPRAYFETNGFKFDPYAGLPPTFVQTSVMSEFFPSPDWWHNFEYIKERNRGYDYHEDLFSPGFFELTLEEGNSVIFRASLSPAFKKIGTEWDQEQQRCEKEIARFSKEKEPLKSLKTHAGHYLFHYENKEPGIIAGYQWFREWGRDSMISLAGLTLCRGENELALEILKKYTKYEKDGILPNMFSEEGASAYNCIDSSLLYFRAIQQYIEYTKDSDSVQKFLSKTLENIIRSYLYNGNIFTHLGEDGFIYAGSPDTNLTWMDAMVDGRPVTSRHGAAVEIQALWYNALCFMRDEFGKTLSPELVLKINETIQLFEENFENKFWHEKDNCFVDVYRSDSDRQNYIRPNQLFAIGLAYSCVSKEKAMRIIDTVNQHLLTPYGLRTLSPRNPLFRGEFKGNYITRDHAYHMGMVWPWLIGIYMDALVKQKYKPTKADIKKHLFNTMNEFNDKHLEQYGLFHISELFRPNPDYVAKGCMAQAWSDAEMIRVLDMLK